MRKNIYVGPRFCDRIYSSATRCVPVELKIHISKDVKTKTTTAGAVTIQKKMIKRKESMITVSVKDIVIGEGSPSICVPLTPEKLDVIREEAILADNSGCDLVEWRIDHLDTWNKNSDTVSKEKVMEEITRGLEIIRQETSAPILLTLRTSDEGGLAQIKRRDYYMMIREFVEECDAEIVDIECFDPESEEGFDKIVFLTDLAKENGKRIILSNHDFERTPPAEEIVKRLCIMDSLGADIPKAAYMPQNEEDVHAVIQAAQTAAEYINKPFIALSMGEVGLPTRICNGNSGSAITFAAAARQSAPGQVSVSDMKKYIADHIGRSGNSAKNTQGIVFHTEK